MPSPKSVIVKDKNFRSLRAACVEYNMYHHTVIHRLNKGWSLEEALNITNRVINNKCKGKVYKITNVVNSKIYIGLTTGSLNKRFKQHCYNALVKNKNTKLSRAIRKHGIECFRIELLKKSKDRHKLAKKEAYYINKFDSIINGYNSIKGGGGLGDNYGHEIKYKGVIYKSKAALAAFLNINPNALYRRINAKSKIDKAILVHNRPKILYKDKVYGLTELSNTLGVSCCTLKYRLSKGHCLNGSPKMTNKKGFYKGHYIEGVA